MPRDERDRSAGSGGNNTLDQLITKVIPIKALSEGNKINDRYIEL